jgi:hypothetical protein
VKAPLVVGVIGVAVGLGAGALCIGRARAQAPQPYGYPPPAAAGAALPSHYQYMCLTKLDHRMYVPEVQSKLNQLGAQGWRLLESRHSDSEDVYCFERRY